MARIQLRSLDRNDPNADGRPVIYAVSGVMFTLSALAVALRILSRKLLKMKLYWDDYLILMALPLAWTDDWLVVWAAAKLNFGLHGIHLTPRMLRDFYISFYTFDLIYITELTIAKFSIIAFYWRIFDRQGLRKPLYVISALTGMWWVACTITAVMTCQPVNGFWDLDVPSTCINSFLFYITQAMANILIDVALLTVAMIRFQKLQLSRSQKIAIFVIFILGGFTSLTSVARLTQLAVTFKSSNFDPTFDLIGSAVWSVVESNMAIICASLPSMRPILRWVLHGTIEGSSARRSGRSGSSGMRSSFSRSSFSFAQKIVGSCDKSANKSGGHSQNTTNTSSSGWSGKTRTGSLNILPIMAGDKDKEKGIFSPSQSVFSGMSSPALTPHCGGAAVLPVSPKGRTANLVDAGGLLLGDVHRKPSTASMVASAAANLPAVPISPRTYYPGLPPPPPSLAPPRAQSASPSHRQRQAWEKEQQRAARRAMSSSPLPNQRQQQASGYRPDRSNPIFQSVVTSGETGSAVDDQNDDDDDDDDDDDFAADDRRYLGSFSASSGTYTATVTSGGRRPSGASSNSERDRDRWTPSVSNPNSPRTTTPRTPRTPRSPLSPLSPASPRSPHNPRILWGGRAPSLPWDAENDETVQGQLGDDREQTRPTTAEDAETQARVLHFQYPGRMRMGSR